VIRSFADKRTAALFAGRFVKGLPTDVAVRAKSKLDLIDAAASLEFLLVPPGNRLERLKGDRKEQHSIRVNEQWRICFRWDKGHAYDVEFCDYH
jgi:proteic killer suppression protein